LSGKSALPAIPSAFIFIPTPRATDGPQPVGEGIAKLAGAINRTYLNRILSGKEPVYGRIAEALGLRKVYIVK
jgi:hypothetical protein